MREPGGSLLVSAGSGAAAWARNLLADPRCRVRIGDSEGAFEAIELVGAQHNRAVRELILRYGTPAERLGSGPSFRLIRSTTRVSPTNQAPGRPEARLPTPRCRGPDQDLPAQPRYASTGFAGQEPQAVVSSSGA